MKRIVKIFSAKSGKHLNTFMLCGSGSASGHFDKHDTYQWVSYPYGTIYPEVFKDVDEAITFLDNKKEITYEVMSGCQLTLVKANGDYTTATPLLRNTIKEQMEDA